MSTTSTMSDGVFESWLTSGTTRTVETVLYNDPTLEAEFEELEARREAAEQASSERVLDSPNPFAAIERDEEALLARLEASKSVWTLKALLDSEFDAALTEFPEPTAPQMLPRAAPAKAKKAWERERDAFVKGAAEAERERRLVLIAKAVVSVATVHGEVDAVTVDQLRTMLGDVYGTYRISVLWEAVKEARRGDVKVPSPK